MQARILTKDELDEIEEYLKGNIKNDKKLIGFNKKIFLHTVAHEMGHLRTATEKNFSFSYIRVYRYICYIDKDKNPQLQKKRLTCWEYIQISHPYWEYIQIHKPYGIKDMFKSGPNGQCVVFISDPTVLKDEDDYRAVLNAGPKATAKFVKEQNIILRIIFALHFRILLLSNPEMDSDCSWEKIAYKSKAKKERSDQNSIEKIRKDQKFFNKLNSRFKDVHLYMTGDGKKESLLNKKDYGSMLAVAKVIRENYLEVSE